MLNDQDMTFMDDVEVNEKNPGFVIVLFFNFLFSLVIKLLR